ncbi:MAG: cation diffusion facilitator family transporter [Betaproteobacteria bacterium]
MEQQSAQPSLRRYAWMSIAAALATIVLKGCAWWLTGSVGLLSDAIESFVNLAAAFMALWMLALSEQPADAEHPFGHGKAEYFSSAFEGMLIVVAALSIAYSALERLLHPQPLEALGLGLAVSVLASALNAVVARILLKVGREHRSATLEADAHHLLTDVWTSLGVVAGVGLVALSGWAWLDPAVALLVAVNILWTGSQLMQRSASALLDASLPAEDLARIDAVLRAQVREPVACHSLRTRQAGRRSFIALHLRVPGHWSVSEAHRVALRIEAALGEAVQGSQVSVRLEPSDPAPSPGMAPDGRWRAE